MGKILTVTIPSYNVENYLEKNIPTFLAEKTRGDIEILIVNDGSKDRTLEIGRKLEEAYPGIIRVIDKENGGHGSTINKGIECAAGTYFKVVDGDDWVDPEAFVSYVEALKTLDTDIVMTPFFRVNETTLAKEKQTFQGVAFGQTYLVNDILHQLKDQYQMHSATFRTEILKKIPKISEHCFYVDQEFILYPLQFCRTMIFLDIPIYQYRVGSNEQSMNLKNMQKNREMHKRVSLHMLDYLNHHDFEENVKTFLEGRVAGLCSRQAAIYLSMDPDKAVKEELITFLNTVKQKSDKIYRMMPGEKMQMLRKSYGFYGILARLSH